LKRRQMDNFEKVDAITAVIEHAMALQRTADTTIAQVARAGDVLAALPDGVRSQVAQGLSLGLAQPAVQAGERMAGHLQQAVDAANAVAARLSAMERSITAKVVFVAAGVTVAGGLSVACVAYCLGVTPWQMGDLRAERAELESSMARLRASGADGEITQCIDRRQKLHPCAKFDTRYGKFNGDYWVIKAR